MATAEIIIGPRAIRTDGLIDKRYNLNGFLIQFTIISSTGNIVYIHVSYEDFKQSDIKQNNVRNVRSGYYQKQVFFDYRAGKRTLIEVQNTDLMLEKKVGDAIKDDVLKVNSLYVTSPYDSFYKLAEFSFVYDGNSKNLLDDRLNIRIPNGTNPTHVSNNNATFEAKEFYRKRKVILDSFSSEDKPKAALALTKVTLLIDMINKDVFPAFYLGDTDYIYFVTSQNEYWQNGALFPSPTLVQLDVFLKQLIGYYYASFPNFQAISDALGIQKLYWLASVMPPVSLGAFPLDDKLILLQFIAKNKLSKSFEMITEEELVINICSSFNDVNFSQINPFLEALVSKKWRVDSSSSETLFETLYVSMSTSTNFKEGLLSISNWVMGTDYKPTQTKGQFVQTIYALWTLSKYNPYYTDGSLKTNTIAFTEKDNELVSFTNTNDTSNYLFKYTHYTASDPFYWPDSFDVKGYKKVRPDASPIVMPYNSYSLLGIFFDNFSFKFDGSKLLAFQDLPYISGYRADGSGNEWKLSSSVETYYGGYDIFQPVGLLSTNLETKTGVSTVNGENIEENGQNINALIPIFALKFIDDAGDRSDVETMIGYAVDVLTTATGFGNLTRLRYLRWASTGVDGIFSISGLRIVIAGVEFTSGALGLLANLITCDENDEFCNGLKTFIRIFQVSSLSLTAVNGLISGTTALQKAAFRLRQIAGGANELEILNNIKNRIRNLNPSAIEIAIDELAKGISNSGKLYSGVPVHLFVEIIGRISTRIKQSKNIKLHSDYTNAIIREIITEASPLDIDNKTIIDFIVFANREERKYRPPNEIKLRINYYAKEIRERGFPAGFDSKIHYKAFCDVFTNKLKENLIQLDPAFEAIINRAEFTVKGSAVVSFKPGDPNIHSVPLPGIKVDDLDLGISLSNKDYKAFGMLLEKVANRFGDNEKLIEKISKGRSSGKFQYDIVFNKIPVGTNNFYNEILSVCEPILPRYSRVNGKPKIGFAIIRKGDSYDNFPELPFLK